jgi:hypothetical protein
MYKCIRNRPDNKDTLEERTAKEGAVSAAFFQYLATTGPFKDFDEERTSFEASMVRFCRVSPGFGSVY